MRHKPQVVFLDIMMPAANEGFDLLDMLRRDPQTRNIVVAMITSRTGTADREMAMAKGADGFFSKPFNLQEIVRWATQQLRPGEAVK